MKKIILSFVLFSFCLLPSFAIDWANTTSVAGKPVSVDKDSIKETKGYYFYNVKIRTKAGEDVVVTMQSVKTHPFCARIKHYKLSQYEELKGNYDNIALEMTTRLEPVTFESRAYAAYKLVKEILKEENRPKITF